MKYIGSFSVLGWLDPPDGIKIIKSDLVQMTITTYSAHKCSNYFINANLPFNRINQICGLPTFPNQKLTWVSDSIDLIKI